MDDLPTELVELISLFAPQNDIASLCLASTRLADICRRSLYHSLAIDSNNVEQTASCLTTLADAPRCARFVRELEVVKLDIKALASHCPKLPLPIGLQIICALQNLVGLETFSFGAEPSLFVFITGVQFPRLRSCTLPYFLHYTSDFLEQHRSTLQTLIISPRLTTQLLTAADAAEIEPLTFPRLNCFVGPSTLAERWLPHSSIEHLIVDCRLIPDAASNVLRSVNNASLASCTMLVEGWHTEPLAAVVSYAPAVRVLTIIELGCDDDEDAYEAFLSSADKYIAQLPQLLALRVPTSPKDLQPDKPGDTSPAVLAELAHLRRWAACSRTLLHAALHDVWQWAPTAVWLATHKADAVRVAAASDSFDVTIAHMQVGPASDENVKTAVDAWCKRLDEMETIVQVVAPLESHAVEQALKF
ncbi:hypothetical protein MIND_01427600 [Mycena indigotica]|uniref:F-box domain-containing protein n=1 Tax=Mycena indigotica TaxID=2126181 RepID=A0A8H6RZP1_9AGAR|nr:uncharacterized protein MIND_01427600 [Mycena indigotica]KAF7288610.1 hypothetical protein MIND_01427600 [Mycena indigotica]